MSEKPPPYSKPPPPPIGQITYSSVSAPPLPEYQQEYTEPTTGLIFLMLGGDMKRRISFSVHFHLSPIWMTCTHCTITHTVRN